MNAARLVRAARFAADQTQVILAARAGVSRGTVAAIETGARSPSWQMLSTLLAAAGKQMRIEVEPLDEDVRRAVDAQAGDSTAVDNLSMIIAMMEGLVDIDYRFEGLAAASMLGAPIPLDGPIGLALPEGPEAESWLAGLLRTGAALVRPNGGFGPMDGVKNAGAVARLIEVSEGGRFELEFWLRYFAVRFVPPEEAARAVLVVAEHAQLRVQPMDEIETTDRDAARVLRLLREQAQDARG